MSDKYYRLCYIRGDKAYFTTQSLDKQWGDDWDDVPYEHNAGYPYEYRERIEDKPWDIKKIYFDGPLEQPCDKHFNLPYSVEDINKKKKVPWLVSPQWMDENIRIYAGCPFEDFKKTIWSCGGHIYVEENQT